LAGVARLDMRHACRCLHAFERVETTLNRCNFGQVTALTLSASIFNLCAVKRREGFFCVEERREANICAPVSRNSDTRKTLTFACLFQNIYLQNPLQAMFNK
jgi:hypothetical protein